MPADAGRAARQPRPTRRNGSTRLVASHPHPVDLVLSWARTCENPAVSEPHETPEGENPTPPIPSAPQAHPYAPYPGGPTPGQPYGLYPPPGAWGPRPTNGMAVASMVLGILWLYWLGSILALIFGYIAKKQIEQRYESGGGMATAGIVLGWVGVGVLAALLAAVAISIAVS